MSQPDYDLAADLLLDPEFFAGLSKRLTLIADREEKGEWLPKARKGATGAIGKSLRGSPPSDNWPVTDAWIEESPEWRREGLCQRVEGDWFEIPGGGLEHQKQKKFLELATCEACDVMEECREYGAREPYGIWGGLLPRERKDKHRK